MNNILVNVVEGRNVVLFISLLFLFLFWRNLNDDLLFFFMFLLFFDGDFFLYICVFKILC